MRSHMCVLMCVCVCALTVCVNVFDSHKRACMWKSAVVEEQSMLSCLFYVSLSMAGLWGKFPAVAEASGS